MFFSLSEVPEIDKKGIPSSRFSQFRTSDGGHKTQLNIYLVVSVDIGELPLVAGDAHPLKLRPEVDELPPFLSLLVVLFGVVGERVELLIGYFEKEREP